MKIYGENTLWEILESKVAAGLEITDGEISLAIAYIMDEQADKQGYSQAESIINDIKKLQDP